MEDKILQSAGETLLDAIREQYDAKGFNDTGKGYDSLSYSVEDNKIIIEGLARVLFLQYGRAPGNPPPFDSIREWVERKLNVEEGAVWIVTKTIVDKIAKEGTAIFKDKAKGLELEIILNDIMDELTEIYLTFKAENVVNSIISTWNDVLK